MARRASSPAERAPWLLLVDKPVGPTSHAVVQWIRRQLGVGAVGHCGTLDPLASGLLVVLGGVATRLAELFADADKSYTAQLELGRRTDSGDLDGRVLERAPVTDRGRERIVEVLAALEGEQSLAPPAHSAVRVDGQRAHVLVRRGVVAGLAPRPMVIRARSEPRWRGPARLEVDWTVSKGTYIRSIVAEVGRRAGLPCVLSGLRRTASGALGVEQALAVTARERAPGHWELGLGEGERGADEPARALRAAMVGLPDALPCRWSWATDEPARALLRRAAAGQRLGAWAPAALGIPVLAGADSRAAQAGGWGAGDWFGAALGDEAERLLVAFRAEPGPSGLRWAPRKVLRWSERSLDSPAG